MQRREERREDGRYDAMTNAFSEDCQLLHGLYQKLSRKDQAPMPSVWSARHILLSLSSLESPADLMIRILTLPVVLAAAVVKVSGSKQRISSAKS